MDMNYKLLKSKAPCKDGLLWYLEKFGNGDVKMDAVYEALVNEEWKAWIINHLRYVPIALIVPKGKEVSVQGKYNVNHATSIGNDKVYYDNGFFRFHNRKGYLLSVYKTHIYEIVQWCRAVRKCNIYLHFNYANTEIHKTFVFTSLDIPKDEQSKDEGYIHCYVHMQGNNGFKIYLDFDSDKVMSYRAEQDGKIADYTVDVMYPEVLEEFLDIQEKEDNNEKVSGCRCSINPVP